MISAGGLSLVDRIRTPLERKEVGDDDCAKTKGCPALTPNPAHQPASYGWTQLTVDTLLEELASSRGIPDCVGITEDDLKKAKERSRQAANWFNKIDDEQDPDHMPADFAKQTGLSADDYRAIVYWKRLEDIVDDYSPNRDPDQVAAHVAAGAAHDRAVGHRPARMRLAQVLLEAHAVSLGRGYVRRPAPASTAVERCARTARGSGGRGSR